MIEINNEKDMQKYYQGEINTYVFNDDIEFKIDIEIEASIKAHNIEAYDIKAWDIDAYNIIACNIDVNDIVAIDINAHNIKAFNILYYAICIAYKHFECKSVVGRRKNSIHKCLDGEIKLKEE